MPSMVRNVAACGIALLAAVLLGFRPDATLTDWALTLALLAGYILAVSSLAVLWGLLVKSVQAAGAFSFADNQPITPIVEALRSLLLDQPMGSFAAVAAAWLTGTVLLSVPTAALLFRRRTST